MKRRKFLLGVGSTAVAGSALIGSGAFSEVRAQRQVTIEVAEDPNAYLGMNDCIGRDGEPTNNSSFAEIDEDGHLAVDMGPSGSGGTGVNSDSTSWFDNVFQICNQGKECVGLWIDEKRGEDPERVTFYVDSDNPPARYVEDDLVTRERVQNDSGLQEIGNSEEDAIRLDLGECVCVGIQTYTEDDDSFNIESPSEGDQLIDGVTIAADVEASVCDTTTKCPWLTGEYRCTTYERSSGEYNRTGTRFQIFNEGDLGTQYDLAVANSPSDFKDDRFIEASTDQRQVVDASYPKNAIVAWDGCDAAPPEGFPEEFVRWRDYKNLRNVEDLDDWYDKYGTGPGSPPGAPSDFDDDLWVSELTLPEFSADGNADDQEGPDKSIPEEQYPDMDDASEEEGWITCQKNDNQNGSQS
jgi:hypothetical protein